MSRYDLDTSVEHMRVAANAYFHHHNNHTIVAPDPQCIYCEGRLSADGRYEDGVIYLGDEE